MLDDHCTSATQEVTTLMKVWSATSSMVLNAGGEDVIYIPFLFIRIKPKMVT